MIENKPVNWFNSFEGVVCAQRINPLVNEIYSEMFGFYICSLNISDAHYKSYSLFIESHLLIYHHIQNT